MSTLETKEKALKLRRIENECWYSSMVGDAEYRCSQMQRKFIVLVLPITLTGYPTCNVARRNQLHSIFPLPKQFMHDFRGETPRVESEKANPSSGTIAAHFHWHSLHILVQDLEWLSS